MRAYSEDLGSRVVAAVDGGMSRSEAARLRGRATVQRYLALRRETGALAPRPRHGPPRIKSAASKVKALLRTAAARTHEALAAAIWASLKAITSADAAGYFTHAGYPPLAHPA
jgi:transposase